MPVERLVVCVRKLDVDKAWALCRSSTNLCMHATFAVWRLEALHPRRALLLLERDELSQLRDPRDELCPRRSS